MSRRFYIVAVIGILAAMAVGAIGGALIGINPYIGETVAASCFILALTAWTHFHMRKQ